MGDEIYELEEKDWARIYANCPEYCAKHPLKYEEPRGVLVGIDETETRCTKFTVIHMVSREFYLIDEDDAHP